MEREFVPYELALRMKQLGFDEPCLGFYDTFNCEKVAYGYSEGLNKAPTFSQAFRWFRENYNLYCTIERVEYIDDGEGFMWSIFNNFHNAGEELVSYEEAELECLTKLIEITEQNK